jgi:hypothetical protein
MPSQIVSFEAADVEELYHSGKPSTWEEMLKRAEQAAGRRRRVSSEEAKEMTYTLTLLRERGGAIPDTARECYLQMIEALGVLPGPGAYPV